MLTAPLDHDRDAGRRPQRFLRWIAIFLSMLVILFCSVIVLVRSQRFHRHVMAMVIADLQQATGGRTEIRNYYIHWYGLAMDLDDVLIHGTETDPNLPLVRADRITMGLKGRYLLRGKVEYNSIILEHPAVRLNIDAQGRNNIPVTPATTGQTENVFDMAIGHITLNNGEIYYNDKYISVAADLHDVQAKTTFSILKSEYSGTFSYSEGHVLFGGYTPLEHNLQAEFSASRSGFTLKSLQLKSGSSSLTAQAELQNYSNPSMHGTYQGSIFTGELRNWMKDKTLPAGVVNTTGTINYQSHSAKRVFDNLAIAGKLSTPSFTVELPQARTDVRTLTAEYNLNQGILKVSNARANLLGGWIRGQAILTHLPHNPETHAEATFRDFSLAAARAAIRPPLRSGAGINGRLNGKVQASWHGSFRDLQMRSDASVNASVPGASAVGAPASSLPVQGTIHMAYDDRTQLIALHNTFLRAPHTAVNLDGSLGGHANLGVQAHSDDLREVDRLMRALQASAAPGSNGATLPQSLGLAGSASFNGTIQGRIKDPQVAGLLTATSLQYRGANLRALRANVTLSSSGIALHQGELQTGTQGHAGFDATVSLRNWSYDPQAPVDLSLTADKLQVADIQRMARFQYPISGSLSGNVTLHGPPDNLAGQGSVQITQAQAWQQPIQSLAIKFQGSGNSIRSDLTIATPAGSGTATITYTPKDEAYDLQADFPHLQLERVQLASIRNLDLAGVATATAKGHGTLKDPQLQATLQAPKLHVGQHSLDSLKAEATVAGQQASFKLDSTVSGAPLQAHGTVNLTGDYEATANIDSQVIPVELLLANVLPQYGAEVQGKTQIHASLKGPLKDPNRIEASADIPLLNVSFQKIQIANATPIHVEYHSGMLTLQRAEFKGPGTDLQVAATVAVPKGDGLQATATGTTDLHLLQILKPQWETIGKADLNVNVQGTLAHPQFRGSVRLIDAALNTPDEPIGMENVNGELDLEGGRITIKTLEGQAGGGTFSARGYAIYGPTTQFNLGLTAQDVRFLYPDGVRSLWSGDLNLEGTSDSASLSGQMEINSLSLTQKFDLATFVSQFSGAPSAPSTGFAENVRINITLTSGEELGLASSQLSMQGSADLEIQGTLAQPVIIGRTYISQGELFFEGRRYTIESGVIEFTNPVQTEPIVHLQVTTVVNQFNLSMNMVGPLDRLRTTYTSDPPLPPVDVINLLIRGQTIEASQSSLSTPQSFLAQGLTSQVSSRVQKFAGISSLTIDPHIGGNQGNGGSVLAIQQRVTKNLLFTFATDVRTTQGQVIQMEYQVSRRFSVSGARNQSGGYGLQVKMHKRF